MTRDPRIAPEVASFWIDRRVRPAWPPNAPAGVVLEIRLNGRDIYEGRVRCSSRLEGSYDAWHLLHKLRIVEDPCNP